MELFISHELDSIRDCVEVTFWVLILTLGAAVCTSTVPIYVLL